MVWRARVSVKKDGVVHGDGGEFVAVMCASLAGEVSGGLLRGDGRTV